MPAYIHPDIAESAIDANERAIIEKYGLRVEQDGDRFSVVDSVVRKAKRGKGGRYTGGNLTELLRAAVSEHQACNASADAPSDKKTAKVNSKGNIPETDSTPAHRLFDKNDPTLSTPLVGNMPSEGQPQLERAFAVLAGADATNDHIAADPEPALETSSERSADAPTSETEPTTTDDGQRTEDEKGATKKKPKRQRVPAAPRDSRYLRAVRVIADNLEMVDGVAGKHGKDMLPYQQKLHPLVEGISIASAGHILEAWRDITAVLVERGWLKFPKAPKTASGK